MHYVPVMRPLVNYFDHLLYLLLVGEYDIMYFTYNLFSLKCPINIKQIIFIKLV